MAVSLAFDASVHEAWLPGARLPELVDEVALVVTDFAAPLWCRDEGSRSSR